MCKLEILLKMMCILSSIFSIVAISFQRFANINHPTSGPAVLHVPRAHHRTLLIIIIIWLVAVAITLPLAIWRTYLERKWTDFDEKWCTEYPAKASIKYWIIVISPLIYIPLIVMIIMYWLMIVKINRFTQQLKEHHQQHQQIIGLTSLKRSLKSYDVYDGVESSSNINKVIDQQTLKTRYKQQTQRRSKTEPTLFQSKHQYHRDSLSSYISYSDYHEYDNDVYEDLVVEDHHHPLHLHHQYKKKKNSLKKSVSSLSLPIHKLFTDYDESNFEKKERYQPPQTKPNHQALMFNQSLSNEQEQQQTSKHAKNKLVELATPRNGGDDGAGNFNINSLGGGGDDRQTLSANMHKRSIMFTIIIYCLITFLMWLPFQCKLKLTFIHWS